MLSACLEVGLVAADNKVSEVAAAVLDAAIAPGEPVLEFELEVVHEPCSPDEKGVALRGILGRCLPDDRAVLDTPELGLPLPAGQGLTVEDRHEASVVGTAHDHGEPQRERPEEESSGNGQSYRHEAGLPE